MQFNLRIATSKISLSNALLQAQYNFRWGKNTPAGNLYIDQDDLVEEDNYHARRISQPDAICSLASSRSRMTANSVTLASSHNRMAAKAATQGECSSLEKSMSWKDWNSAKVVKPHDSFSHARAHMQALSIV